ncbi:MAG: ABC transporter permease [Lysinibacillus sp.]
MKQLFIYEWKKILSNRLNQIVLLCSMLAISGMMLLAAFSYTFPDNEATLKGMEAIQAEKETIEKISGIIDEERIAQDIEQYQQLYVDPANSFNNEGQVSLTDSVFRQEVYPKYNYLLLINGVFAGPYASDYELNTLKKIKNPLPPFYETRDANVERLVSNTFSNMQFSEAEQAYWSDKNAQVHTPIEYGYTQGWTELLDNIEFFIFIFLAIVICIAPIFASEYQTGADHIILSSKLGKTKLITVKIATAFLFGAIVLTLHLVITMVIAALTFGLDGASLPVQALHSTNPYNWTIGQFVFMQVVTVYVLLFGLIAVTLWLSAKAKSAFTALIPMVVLLIIPLFLNRTETASFWNHIHSLLPFPALRNTLGNDELTYVSFSLGSFVIDLYTMRILFYVVAGCLMIFYSMKAFKNHQVE